MAKDTHRHVALYASGRELRGDAPGARRGGRGLSPEHRAGPNQEDRRGPGPPSCPSSDPVVE